MESIMQRGSNNVGKVACYRQCSRCWAANAKKAVGWVANAKNAVWLLIDYGQ